MRVNWLLFLSAFACCLSPSVGAQQSRRTFDFDRAERIADQLLGRKAETPVAQSSPQAPTPPDPKLCALCKGALAVECPRHKTTAPCLIEDAPSKSCVSCKDLGWLPCPHCKVKKELRAPWEEMEATHKRAQVVAAAAVEAVNGWEPPDKLDCKLSAYVAPHFSIGSNLQDAPVLACVNHGEALLAKLNEVFRAKCFTFGTPTDTRFFIFKTVKEYQRGLETIWKARSENLNVELALKGSGLHSHAVPSLALTCYDKLRIRQNLEHHFIHVLGHFLVNRVDGERNAPPWIEEGFAAYCETLQLSAPKVYCFAYDFNETDIQRNRDATLKKMAQSNSAVPLVRLMQMTYMDMKAAEYFQAWSLITMLIERDPDKFRAFLKALPEAEVADEGALIPTNDQMKALEVAYGYDEPKLLAVWKQYVLAR
jgi:hypothetical protein